MDFKKIGTAGKVIIAILSLVLAILIIYGMVQLVQTDFVKNIGKPTSSHLVLQDSWIGKIVSVVLGISFPNNLTIETIILHLALFIIIMFALAEIIVMFTTFSEVTSWVIGLCFALIGSVSGVYSWLATIMGFAVGISALGIVLMIVGGIAAAVTLNLGIGGAARRWRMNRQAEIEGMKSEKGSSKVKNAISGLKEVESAFSKGEKA